MRYTWRTFVGFGANDGFAGVTIADAPTENTGVAAVAGTRRIAAASAARNTTFFIRGR